MKQENIQKQRVALYIRVSTDEQAEKFGVDLQKTALKGLINSKPDNFVFAGDNYIYVDEGVSGTINIDERPAFARLKEDLVCSPERERPFDVIAVYKIDRFARQLRILLDVIDLFESHDVRFISANESIDTSTPFGKAMLGIIGIIAELERDTIMQRTADGRLEAFERGIVLGNSAPYGYTKDEQKRYQVFSEEAVVVEEIFRLFVQEKVTVNALAKHLTECKYLSPVASAIHHRKRKGEIRKKNHLFFWKPEAVRRILSDEIYVGKIWGNKTKAGKAVDRSEWVLSPAQAPYIIDKVTYERAHKMLSSSQHTKQQAKDAHVYLLSGILKCDCCADQENGHVVDRVGWHGERRKVRQNWQYYYKCGRRNLSKTSKPCHSLPLQAGEIDKYVIEYTKQLLGNPVAVFEHQKSLKSSLATVDYLKKKDKHLTELLTAIPHRKRRWQEQQAEGLINTVRLKEEMLALDSELKKLELQRDEIQLQLSQHAISDGYISALDLFSDKYDVALEKAFTDRKKLSMILKTLIEEIVIYTRPVKATDLIAGRKKQGQEIPDRIHIKLKLPQDIISQLHLDPVESIERYGFEKKMTPSSGSNSSSGAR